VKDITGRILHQGTLEGGLYPFRSSGSCFLKLAALSVVTSQIWYHRLGHPSHDIQLSILACISVSNKPCSSLCNACQMGKSHKLPFSSSTSMSQSPLALVHCDIWGPTPVLSVSQFKYYVLFIDDYSWYAWLYPMRLKSEFLSIFVAFKALV